MFNQLQTCHFPKVYFIASRFILLPANSWSNFQGGDSQSTLLSSYFEYWIKRSIKLSLQCKIDQVHLSYNIFCHKEEQKLHVRHAPAHINTVNEDCKRKFNFRSRVTFSHSVIGLNGWRENKTPRTTLRIWWIINYARIFITQFSFLRLTLISVNDFKQKLTWQ